MIIGRVTGYEIGKNKEGETESLLLGVELTEPEDIQTVELYRHAGVDYNPVNDSTVIVIPIADALQIGVAVDDGITPESEPGEYEIYSSDNDAKKAKVKCLINGKVKINDGGPAAARVGDEIQVTPVTDPALFTWFAAIAAFTSTTAPTSITGTITSGSGTVEIGD
jgi:hypothetical protein